VGLEADLAKAKAKLKRAKKPSTITDTTADISRLEGEIAALRVSLE
jgi:hypothetical protein